MWKFWKTNKRQYDNVKIVNMADGTQIEGHDAVAAYFESEQKLYEEHGSTITFQLSRLDLQATTFDTLQGPTLAEFRVEGSWVSGTDTVAMVKDRLRELLKDKATPSDRITLYFDHRPMVEDDLFYADHFIMLPAWVQVLLHDGDAADIEAAIQRIRSSAAPP